MEITIEQALQTAAEAYKAGQVQEADRLYTAILKAQPKHPDANHNMGVLAVGVGKVEQALPFFKTALKANPNTAQFWLSYIDALIKLGKLVDGKAVLDQAKNKGAKGDGFNKLEQRLQDASQGPLEANQIFSEPQPKQPNILDKLKLDQAISLAKKKAKEGNPEEARRIYQDILTKFPKNKRANDGLKWLTGETVGKASKGQNPPQDQLQSLANLYSQGQLQLALIQAETLVTQFPQSAILFNIQGVVLKGLGQLDASVEAYSKALAIKPDYAEAYKNMGVSLQEHGKLEEAIEAYNKALAIKPDYAEAYNNMGNALKNQGKVEEAVASYKKALSFKPDHADAYYNMGIALQDQSKLEEAISSYKKALSLKPDDAEAHNNIGNALKEQGKLDDAKASYEKALSLKPDYAKAYNNMGSTLKDQCKLDDAKASYEKALFLKPDYAEAYNNMGTVLQDQGKLDDAIASFEAALSLKPDYAEAHKNMGRLHWLQGNFQTAFELLEYRWLVKSRNIGEPYKTKKSEWEGEIERLFVWKEQGIGDEIMFSSLLIEAEQQASSLTVECDSRLIPIYKRSFPSKTKFIDDRKKINEQDYDSHVAIGSLSKYFRSDISDFLKTSAGWLKADQARAANYRNSLLSKPSSKLIGLSWFTRTKKVNSHFRNIDVQQLLDHLIGLPLDFVSLQYALSKEELIEINNNIPIDILSVDELDLFNDIDGLASLISACDIVISIDNINAHLSGALGVDTRVMLPKVADERWGLSSKRSYWYDSVKLYRQEKWEDWSVPLLGLKKDIIELLQ